MPGNDGSPLADTEVHHLRSEHVGDEFRIFVGQCGARDGEVPAALYVTDANGLFGGAVDTVRLMQLSAHLPPLLVVGIGYRRGAIHDTLAARTRDLTPTVDPTYARIFPDQSRPRRDAPGRSRQGVLRHRGPRGPRRPPARGGEAPRGRAGQGGRALVLPLRRANVKLARATRPASPSRTNVEVIVGDDPEVLDGVGHTPEGRSPEHHDATRQLRLR